MSLLNQAIELAITAHAGQTDEDQFPHIFHCYEVFCRVQEMLDEWDLDARLDAASMGAGKLDGGVISRIFLPPLKYSREEIFCSAFLHDSVEDSFVTLPLIETQFGKNTRDIVDGVTRRGLGKDETKEFYRDFIYRVKSNPGSHIIKVADLAHNLSRAPKIKKASWRNKLEFKYSIALRVLNGADQPSWEKASAFVQYDDGGLAQYFIADPNGKRVEVAEEEFKSLTKKP